MRSTWSINKLLEPLAGHWLGVKSTNKSTDTVDRCRCGCDMSWLPPWYHHMCGEVIAHVMMGWTYHLRVRSWPWCCQWFSMIFPMIDSYILLRLDAVHFQILPGNITWTPWYVDKLCFIHLHPLSASMDWKDISLNCVHATPSGTPEPPVTAGWSQRQKPRPWGHHCDAPRPSALPSESALGVRRQHLKGTWPQMFTSSNGTNMKFHMYDHI